MSATTTATMNANSDHSPAGQTPAVSVILPAYNAEDYIHQAVQSILAQTHTDFELIIVDDGSSDRTLEIARGYETAYDAVKIIANGNNRGIPQTRNIGIKAARGEYIAMQDADDASLPARLAKQTAYMEAHPQIALCGTARYAMSARGEINRRSGRLLSARPVATADNGKSVHPTFDDLLQANHFVQGSVMLRKRVLDEVGNYDERFAYMEDYELWLRIARHFQTANLREPLYALRSHPASATKQNTAESLLYRRLAVNSARGKVSDAIAADIKQHGITAYHQHLTPAEQIHYHKSLANTFYRHAKWSDALREYQTLKNLHGANTKTYARMALLYVRRWRGG